jgi:hypothetical protein
MDMIHKFLNDFKLNLIPHDIQFEDALKDPNSEIINVTVRFDPSEQIETDSFVVSRGIDFFHSVQHNYHKELIFDILIGGQLVWSATIKPDSIEWIFGGMPLLLININFSMVRFIIRDDDQILHTNQLDLTLYYGAIIDSDYRRFIAQNPPYCYVKERSYLHTNYVMDAEENDIMLKRNLIFYPHR